MNPISWLFRLSAKAAEKRAGVRDPLAYSYDPTVDSRDYEAWTELHGAAFFIENLKWPERWAELSPDSTRYGRIVEAGDGSFRLSVYERQGDHWRNWEGPSVLATLEEAQALGRRLLVLGREEGEDAF